MNDIIPREDMDVSGTLGEDQKDEEIQSPQRKKNKKYKRTYKKDLKKYKLSNSLRKLHMLIVLLQSS